MIKKVAVTGSSGKAGRWTVRELLAHDYRVIGVDQVRSAEPGVQKILADLTDLGQTIEALAGVDAIIHHAAIPAPNIHTDGRTFENNTVSTYNVFLAAKVLGIKRVVWASSETTLGLPLNENPPAHVPVDETLPLNPRSGYAHSKQLGEETARYFGATADIQSVALRFSNIMEPQEYKNFETWQDDPARRIWNLWGYVDCRDVAQSCRLGLTAQLPSPARAYIIAADDTVMRTPSVELMKRFLPNVPTRTLRHGRATLLSIDLARKELGYDPKFSWIETA